MSTRYTIEQQETIIVSSSMEEDALALQQLQRELFLARHNMTYEGGLPDAEPVDTPTERGRRAPSERLATQRMANEGGPVPLNPVDTPTQRDTRSLFERKMDDIRAQSMIAEGGHAYLQSEYDRAGLPHREHGIITSVRASRSRVTEAHGNKSTQRYERSPLERGMDDTRAKSMIAEGGHAYLQSEYDRAGLPHREHGIITSVRTTKSTHAHTNTSTTHYERSPLDRKMDDTRAQSMISEGGHSHLQSEYDRAGLPHREHGIITAVRRAAQASADAHHVPPTQPPPKEKPVTNS